MYDVINNLTAEIEKQFCERGGIMDGVLIIRKEKGYTSHDVVAKLRGILHMKKIGHTGTLDPDAEGVLPVVLGRATRLVRSSDRKAQEPTRHFFTSGIETDTQDMTGTVLNEKAGHCFRRRSDKL